MGFAPEKQQKYVKSIFHNRKVDFILFTNPFYAIRHLFLMI